jgi:hypothetical protein
MTDCDKTAYVINKNKTVKKTTCKTVCGPIIEIKKVKNKKVTKIVQ